MLAAKSSASSGKAMSRIGRAPITVPAGVEVTIDGNNVAVKGPKGQLSLDVHPNMSVALDDGVMTVTRPDDSGPNRSLHGLTRTLVSNMVTGRDHRLREEAGDPGRRLQGLQEGFRPGDPGRATRTRSWWYRRRTSSSKCPCPRRSWSRASTSNASARWPPRSAAIRKPEPYKGKGIRYEGEVVRRKVGKRA